MDTNINIVRFEKSAQKFQDQTNIKLLFILYHNLHSKKFIPWTRKMLNQIKRVKEIKKFRDHNIRMILNVNIEETLNTYATANIKVQHNNSEKKDRG